MSTASHNLLTWANLLTAARVLMIVPLTHAVLQQLWLWAAILFTAAAVSDYYDGKVARALNQTSPWGALFDHASDALLVSVGCGALAGLGLINPYLPWLIGAAFIQYMLDSKALAGQELRTSRIGRSNGVAYYVLLGTGIGAIATAGGADRATAAGRGLVAHGIHHRINAGSWTCASQALISPQPAI